MPKRADRRRRGKPGSKSIRTSVPARTAAPPTGDSVNDRLARLVDTPHLAKVVPHLAPEVLHHLIRERGLEACGAFIAATTPQQLASLLDLDLWHAAPGRDDQFDERRFGVWLEALINEGEAVAVHVVAAMDPEVAIAGLSRYVRVFDPGVFQPTAQSDDELPDFEVAGYSPLETEIGGYLVRARTSETWDAIVSLLAALADDRPDVFHGVMEGCRRLSNSRPEIDGLDDLLLEAEQQLHEVSIAREQRRSDQGYLSAGDARAFLNMARRGQSCSTSINGIATAYFRTLDADLASPAQASRREDSEGPPHDPEVSKSVDALLDLLVQAGVAPTRSRALLGPVGDAISRVTPLEPLMEHIQDADQAAYFARNRELAFLANALVAGCSVYSRAFTVQEAWDATIGICNIGLEVLSNANDETNHQPHVPPALPDNFLIGHDLLSAFEAGWKLLYREVSLFVTERLIAILKELESVDSPVQRDLYQLRRELQRSFDEGAPWQTEERLEAIAMIDMPAWASLCGLLSECPVQPAAMIAILDRRAGSVSATEFEWFTTRAQIRKVHEFATTLRDILRG